MRQIQKPLIWGALALVLTVPLVLAAYSPLLKWREPVYVMAGFAGITGFVVLLVQPLLIGKLLPGLSPLQNRRFHKWTGMLLVLAIILHVGGLWITSPPDVIDALLFSSPTPFSVWGVTAMWAVFISAIIAVFRRKFQLSPKAWRIVHLVLAAIIITGTIIHSLLIEGTMENVSKIMLCVLVVVAFLKVVIDMQVWRFLKKK